MFTDPSGEFVWFVVGGAILGAYIGASTSADDGFNLNPAKWGDDWGKRAIIGGIVGAGAGALAATAFGGAGTMALMSNGMGGSSLGWSMTSSALTMGNLNMGMTALMGGDINDVWKAGVSGLISGAITGGVNFQIGTKYDQIGFWKGFGIHGAVGGTTSLIDGAIQGKKGWDLVEYTARGAAISGLIGGTTEGLKSRFDGKSFWTGNDKRVRLGNGCYQYIHRDPITLNMLEVGERGLTTSISINKGKYLTIPWTPGWDFSGKPFWVERGNWWYDIPVLIPFIPYIGTGSR